MTEKNKKESKNFTNNSDNDEFVLLLDSKPQIEILRNIITQKNPIIITFNYETHKFLLENKIIHQISDDYITDDDLRYIQQSSFIFAKWYDQKTLKQLLQYDEINLGELFYIEFHYHLVSFLKIFAEISKVFSKFNSARFFASSLLYDMMINFTRNVEDIKINTSKSNKFLYDTINVKLKIGNKFIPITIKRSHYLKAKEISEKIIHSFFRPKDDSSKKYVLFVDFDTIRYKNLFLALPQTSVNLMYYGRRRPAIWNYKSFSIIRKSGCKIATQFDVLNKNFISTIKRREIVEEKIKNLLDQEVFLMNFFSISDTSFWNCLKPMLLELCQKRFFEAIFEIELAKKLFKKYKFKSVVVWSESAFNKQIVIGIAKKFQIPIVLVQHGMSFETSETFHLKNFDGVSPIKSDKFIVWGQILEEFSKTHGIKSEKLEALGTPLYDELFEKMKSGLVSSNNFVLLATSSPVKSIIQDLKIKTTYEYETAIKKICQIVLKQNKKLVIKLHPFQDELDITKLVEEIDPKITIIKSGDILPLIESCELLITIDLSTAILEAQILKKPVISVHVKDYPFGEAVVFSSGSCLQTNMDNLESMLNNIFNKSEFRNNMIQKGNLFVNSYLSHHGDSSKSILSFLENFE